MKRVRYQEEAGREEETLNYNNVAKALILLSETNKSEQLISNITRDTKDDDHQYKRVFGCKTCSRKFSSFQALGGHSASHKKPKLSSEYGNNRALMVSDKPKTHGCSICGVEFAIGQALGGHMTRHRGANTDGRYLVENKDASVIAKNVMLFGFVLATI